MTVTKTYCDRCKAEIHESHPTKLVIQKMYETKFDISYIAELLVILINFGIKKIEATE